MTKILSQAGNSLADTYDVEGSIAGIDQLETHELPIVHEMGNTVFSERLSGNIRRVTSGSISQSSNWDVVLSDLGSGISRILGVFVFSDSLSRLSLATLSVRADDDEREVPIFAWDSNEASFTARIDDSGIGDVSGMGSNLNVATLPSILIGRGQSKQVGQIAFRGTTNAFGAGTVVTTALIYIAFSAVGGVPGNTSSRGLPVPSW